MKPSVIVWDLETVPDLGGFAAAVFPRTHFREQIATPAAIDNVKKSRFRFLTFTSDRQVGNFEIGPNHS
jgi:hypothetical protein